MFTSRAEYRLSLRADNADERLTPVGVELGLVSTARKERFERYRKDLADWRSQLAGVSLTPNEAERFGINLNRDGQRRTAMDLLAYPDIDPDRIRAIWPELHAMSERTAAALKIEAGYAVYLERQESDILALRREEGVSIPPDFDYHVLSGLSNELKTKLSSKRPANLAQASRIEGMTPAASALLLANLRRQGKEGRVS